MIERRILGSEVEYGIVTVDPARLEQVSNSIYLINQFPELKEAKVLWDYEHENPLMDARGFEVHGEKERPAPDYNRALNKLLQNGGRFYVDGAHPEYSTPECTNPRDAVLFEKAGDTIVDTCRRVANTQLDKPEQLVLYKNNSDGKGNSYGYHENYLISRSVPFETITKYIVPFLVTRQIFAGAGKVGCEERNRDVRYQISQRADFFKVLMDLNTMVKRPIVNTRDEPHADARLFRRFHVIIGDANMSEYTTYLKLGTASLVMSMIENGIDIKRVEIEDPVSAIKEFSYDTSLKVKVKMADGRYLSAIEIQKEYLSAAKEFSGLLQNGQQDADLISRWEDVLDRLAADPMSLSTKIDWIIKKKLINTYLDKKGLSWDSPRARAMDLQYHNIDKAKGLYFTLERAGRTERIVTDQEIGKAMKYGPEDTRAYFRSACINKFGNSVYAASWTSVLVKPENGDSEEVTIKKIPIIDPCKGTKDLVGELIASSATVKELLEKLTS